MKNLGIRNITLLCEGLRVTGNFKEAYYYVEESLYVNEAETIQNFCNWADENIGGGSERNMEILFQAFINPENKEAVAKANEIRDIIKDIHKVIDAKKGG